MRRTFEVREAGGELHGTMITEGAAASGGRAEVWRNGSVEWGSTGVGIRTEHGEPVQARAHPTRQSDGRITVRTRANDAIRRRSRPAASG